EGQASRGEGRAVGKKSRTARGEAARSGPGTAILGTLLLAVGTLAVFAQAFSLPYADLDDDLYASRNRFVAAGLTTAGLREAFTSSSRGNGHPVRWRSLMLDAQLFGNGPLPHHAVNVGLHAANAALLFLFLARLSGALGRSLVASALFAFHPLRVESVA